MSFNFRRWQKDRIYQVFRFLAIILFQIIRVFYRCKPINYPKDKCVFALWHAHQCGVFTCNLEHKTIIMVSNSRDGEIISSAANSVGVPTIRGSMNRGGAKASLELIKKIKDEGYNGALTIDGPKGPNRVVKKGIIEIARLSGVPIVPAIWWSPQKTFIQFNSWDKFRFPLIGTKLVMKFAQPIEVPSELNEQETEKIRLEVENTLFELYKDVKENYYKYLKS